MRFELLGPLTLAVQTGEPTAVPGARQRVLLAALLLSANMPVSRDALAEAVWDGAPPAGAAQTLRSHVRRLREILGPQARARITACEPGYLIRVQPSELDVLEFEALCQECGQGRREGRWAQVSAAARRAVELWRGDPLADVSSQLLRDQFLPRLEQLRLQVLEDGVGAGLRLSQHDRLIPWLRDLTAREPLRERFWAQLMEALAGAGRQAEALEAYRQARRILTGELGVEPAPELQRLYQQILAADSAPQLLTPARSPVTPARPPAVAVSGVPRQLPGGVRHFVGRAGELERLSAFLDETSGAGTAMTICVIAGTAGVGKTALALHWARQVASRFGDGQLYVNLRGFEPSDQPMPPAEAIRGFLDALKVPAERIPANVDAQAGLYRSLLAGRRILILLDNARDVGQVRPLLVGSPGCLVLVTSRHRLAGIAVGEGARLVSLDVLTRDEARRLLAARLGAGRVAAEPAAAGELIELCARLPLALAIVAALASAGPELTLTGLATDLRDAAGRLDRLDAGDAASSIRSVFSWSYRSLPEPAQRMFRLLGLHAGPDITAPAAASLAGLPLPAAQRALRELVEAHMLTEHPPGRYAFHDLLGGYAAEQADATEDKRDQAAATRRILSHYLHTAHAAVALLSPSRPRITLDPAPPGVSPEPLAGYQQALDWFEAEHQVLLAAVTRAADVGFDACAWQLPWAMTSFLDRRGEWHQQAGTQTTALAAATRLGDPAGQAAARYFLATAGAKLGHYGQARVHLSACLELYERLGDRAGEARVYQVLSWLTGHEGRHTDALGHARHALTICRAVGDLSGQAVALNSVGWQHALLGQYRQARTSCRRAVALHHQLGNRLGEAYSWDSLGYIEHQQGRYGQAAACYREALRLFRELGDRYCQADTLAHLGDACAAAGRADAARDAWRQALAILDDLGQPDAANVRARLGFARRALEGRDGGDHSGGVRRTRT